MIYKYKCLCGDEFEFDWSLVDKSEKTHIATCPKCGAKIKVNNPNYIIKTNNNDFEFNFPVSNHIIENWNKIKVLNNDSKEYFETIEKNVFYELEMNKDANIEGKVIKDLLNNDFTPEMNSLKEKVISYLGEACIPNRDFQNINNNMTQLLELNYLEYFPYLIIFNLFCILYPINDGFLNYNVHIHFYEKNQDLIDELEPQFNIIKHIVPGLMDINFFYINENNDDN